MGADASKRCKSNEFSAAAVVDACGTSYVQSARRIEISEMRISFSQISLEMQV